jgi:antitoxin CptB
MSTEVNSQPSDSVSSDSQPTVNKARLKWACRRGMLELDVLFIPFVDEAYDNLTAKEQRIFERLLTEQDPDLFAWFMGHKTCEDTELNAMVQFILKRVKV